MRDSGRNTWTYYEPASDAAEVLPPAPWDALANPTVEDLLPGGLALWPRGAAWGSPDGMAAPTTSVLARFTKALLGGFADLYARLYGITQESRAVTLVDSLADWEADYGLPDGCSPALTEDGRKRALVARVRSSATITPQDFIQLARLEGFDIAIEEPAVFECGFSECGGQHTVGDVRQEVFWVVHVYGVADDGTGIDRLRCLFSRLYPAWTQPVYALHEVAPRHLTFNGRVLTFDGAALILSPL